MKMNNILVGLFLGLLAVVQATPVTTVTQIPAKTEDDVYREAVTDGFLVSRLFTTQSPKRNATIQASQQPSSDPTEAVTEAPSEETTTTVFFEDGGDHDTTTRHFQLPVSSSPSHFTSSSMPNDDKPSTTSATQTTEPVSSFDLFSTLSLGSGSGDGEETEQDATTSFYTTSASNTETTTTAFLLPRILEDVEGSGSGVTEETSTAPSTSTALPIQSTAPRVLIIDAESKPGPVQEPLPSSGTIEKTIEEHSSTKTGRQLPIVEPGSPPSKQGTTNGTPGWVIIVGFIVGMAALVMLCVAIATRDKWNGPHQVSQAKPDSSNQQGGQEMETFLHKEEPRENGKSAEYTVIPLEDLPESHSSH